MLSKEQIEDLNTSLSIEQLKEAIVAKSSYIVLGDSISIDYLLEFNDYLDAFVIHRLRDTIPQIYAKNN